MNSGGAIAEVAGEEGVSLHPENDEFQEIPETREGLEKDLKKTRKRAYSKGILKNLFCQWRSFTRFNAKYNINQWPVDEHTISLYARFLAYTFHSPKSIKNYLYGIRTLHLLLGAVPPNLKDIQVRLTLRGIEKILSHTPKQAFPISPEILTDILGFIDLRKRKDRIFWGILLVGFWGMFRKSNLVSDSRKSFDPIKQMTVNHITIKQGLAIVKATWAKNIQNRQRILEVPLLEARESNLCPVKILKILCNEQKKGHLPLFGEGKYIAYTYTQFQDRLRQLLEKAGYNSKAFSTHSLRRGGAVWAHKSGVPEPLIQVHGGWQSDAYKTYLSFPLEVRAAVSLKMREAILKSGL